jgi:hypothetical protein
VPRRSGAEARRRRPPRRDPKAKAEPLLASSCDASAARVGEQRGASVTAGAAAGYGVRMGLGLGLGGGVMT